MKESETYGLNRAKKTKFSPEAMLKVLANIAVQSGTRCSSATPSKVKFDNRVETLRVAIHKIHLDAALVVAGGFRKLGVSDEFVRKGAEGQATRLTDRLMINVEKYGINRATKTKVSPERMLRQLTGMVSN